METSMKKRMMFAVCMVLLAVFCCLSGGAESSPKDENPSSSNKMDAASDAPEKTVYDGETLLKAFFGVPDTGVSLDDLPEPKDLGFLDKSFLGNDADREGQNGNKASEKISSDELNELRIKQYQNAASNPELQEKLNTEVFQAKNTWMDTHFVYTYPVPEGLTLSIKDSGSKSYSNALVWDYHYSDESGRNQMDVRIVMYKSSYYKASDVDDIRDTYRKMFANASTLTNQEITGEDGLPRQLASFNRTTIDKDTLLISTTRHVVFVYKHDNCSYIQIDYLMTGEPGKTFEDNPDDLAPFEALTAGVAYQAPEDRTAAKLPDWMITEKDFYFHVDTKPETRFLMAGQSVKIIPGYRKSNLKTFITNLKGFSFLAVDTEQLDQGNTVPIDPAVASIDAKGTLTAGEVSGPTAVTIVTTSEDTGESQTTAFILLPGIENLELSEQKLTLYAGDSAPMKLQGILTPASAWVYPENGDSNLVWSSSKPDILSVTDNRDTTATIEAIASGNATVTLTETVSKKKATVNVTILQPVTELSIDGPDTIVSGRSAGYKAVIGPKNAGNKKVQWSIDVDESIATVNPNGQLKIGKEAPSGTVITLTCVAEGAATPRVATKTITVE